MHESMLRFNHQGFIRIHKELSDDDIKYILSSARTKYIVVHETNLQILYFDQNYLQSKQNIEEVLKTTVQQLNEAKKISFFGFLGDAALCLIKTKIQLDDFISFFQCEYAEFDRLSQIIGFCYGLTLFHAQNQSCCRCQAKLSYINKNNIYKQCTKCNIEVYPQIQTQVMAFITQKDKVIVQAQRNNVYGPIQGMVEIVETLTQAVYRILEQKLGITDEMVNSVRKSTVQQPWVDSQNAIIFPYHVILKDDVKLESLEEKKLKIFDKDELKMIRLRTDQNEKTEWILQPMYQVGRYLIEEFFQQEVEADE